jgi:hypothetical protein
MGSSASANEWNERSLLTFSAPVMVPGTTLAPGTYEFRIAEPDITRHVIRITNQDTGQLVATVQAVPVQRPEASPETVLRFNPTESGAPVALQAWFYPNNRNGHQFIYPDDQARHIAERTKTLVLSSDAPFGEPTSGQLRVVDASGQQTEWKGDEAALKSWGEWVQSRNTGQNAGNQADDAPPKSTAPIITRADTRAMDISLDQLEDDPKQYTGQRVNVDAEVERVIGPRLFTIDEPNWIDLDGEVMVFMQSMLAAMVREGDRLTVTGTLTPFATLEIDRDDADWFGWFGDEADVDLELDTRMVLVADSLVGGDSDTAMMIRTDGAGQAAGRAGIASTNARTERSIISDVQTLSGGDDELVGRPVTFQKVSVAGMAEHGGFYIGSENDRVYVLPAGTTEVKAGDQVRIEGVVLQMPRGVDDAARSSNLNDEIYVYAVNVG